MFILFFPSLCNLLMHNYLHTFYNFWLQNKTEASIHCFWGFLTLVLLATFCENKASDFVSQFIVCVYSSLLLLLRITNCCSTTVLVWSFCSMQPDVTRNSLVKKVAVKRRPLSPWPFCLFCRRYCLSSSLQNSFTFFFEVAQESTFKGNKMPYIFTKKPQRPFNL